MTRMHILTTKLWSTIAQMKRISGSPVTPSLQNHGLIISRRVFIISKAFESKRQPDRHRMVYALLKEEMAREGGIHALQLRTRTPKEDKETIKQKKEEADTAVEDTSIRQ